MSENETNAAAENADANDDELIAETFDLNPISSAETVKRFEPPIFLNEEKPGANEITTEADEKLNDPIFAALASPRLPELDRENRARLQMQTPTRLYFYWSVKNNPFQVLRKAFGGNVGSYQLIVRLVNQTRNREELHPVEAEGNWWFNVEANSRYRAELGFYAPNRPFVRIMFSNTVETPRKSPSPRPATESDWAVTSAEFAEILDDSGFSADAFEVVLAGDDAKAAEISTRNAFEQLFGGQGSDFRFDFGAEEVRFALLALASGAALENLRGQISERLFAALRENAADLSAEQSLAVLREHFDVFDDEIIEQQPIGSAVFGASLVHFPKLITKRIAPKSLSPRTAPKFLSKLSPISS
ncbi:MAG TPA: DUF4912 domain-containing protein [Pyrinomonadaceae bacterium]|jgi:hypothetical protein